MCICMYTASPPAGMCTDMCADMSVDMSIHLSMDMFIDMHIDIYRHTHIPHMPVHMAALPPARIHAHNHIVMAYIVMALYSYGRYSYGPCSRSCAQPYACTCTCPCTGHFPAPAHMAVLPMSVLIFCERLCDRRCLGHN